MCCGCWIAIQKKHVALENSLVAVDFFSHSGPAVQKQEMLKNGLMSGGASRRTNGSGVS